MSHIAAKKAAPCGCYFFFLPDLGTAQWMVPVLIQYSSCSEGLGTGRGRRLRYGNTLQTSKRVMGGGGSV